MHRYLTFLTIAVSLLTFAYPVSANDNEKSENRENNKVSKTKDIEIVNIVKRGQKVLNTPQGEELIIDYDRQVFICNGVEFPFIVDEVCGMSRQNQLLSMSTDTTWVHLSYDRFEVYIEENYYYNVTPEIDEFFDFFEPRYELMETITGWSSEKFYFGLKLKIYVNGSTTGCYGGTAIPGEAYILFSDPLYNEGLFCAKSGGLGELGDNWPYMGVALHEALHAINPLPILANRWLTEGFSEYYEYNLLSEYGDISQEAADNDILSGTNYYNWEDYVANDYYDTSPDENEIQESYGYSITAWMFSMMRDDYDLDWSVFYNLLNENTNTLYYALYGLGGDYITDAAVIDIFGRAVGWDFETETKPVWRYDGPDGPGWGVRNWESLDWYADLALDINVSNETPELGAELTITSNVSNDVEERYTNVIDFTDVSVRFYDFYNEELILIDEQIIDIDANTFVEVESNFIVSEPGTHKFYVRVDEDNIKMERDETNNADSSSMTVNICVDADGDGYGDPGHPENACPDDNCPDTYNADQSDVDGDGIGDVCDNCTDTDGDGYGNPGFAANTCADDNCPDDYNPSQEDANNDGIGDACCCIGIRGNASGDEQEAINITDITYLVAYCFGGGPVPGCPAEGNADADGGGAINISDITYLVAYCFGGGPEPPYCPNPCPSTVTDVDGNVYETVMIGDQCWMAENLKVTHYRNGDPISHVTDNSTWEGLSMGAYCNYDNDEDYVATYGHLYNWYAVDDSRNIAPVGWHVPTDAEWKQLEMYLGMSQSEADAPLWRGTDEGGKLKETGTTHWQSPNTATNESGFTALPGGYRYLNGNFLSVGNYAGFWSTNVHGGNSAWYRALANNLSEVYRNYKERQYGFSVRCVRD